jgi:hypothetical protein
MHEQDVILLKEASDFPAQRQEHVLVFGDSRAVQVDVRQGIQTVTAKADTIASIGMAEETRI